MALHVIFTTPKYSQLQNSDSGAIWTPANYDNKDVTSVQYYSLKSWDTIF